MSAPSIEATSTVQSHYSLYRQVLSHRRKVRAVTVVPSVDICVDVLIIVIPILGQADCATSIRLRSSQDITARLTALAMTLTNPFAQAQSILNPTAEASTSLWSRPTYTRGFIRLVSPLPATQSRQRVPRIQNVGRSVPMTIPKPPFQRNCHVGQ